MFTKSYWLIIVVTKTLIWNNVEFEMGVVTQTINYKGFLKSRGQNVQNTEFLMYKLILGIDTAV